jgi:hypothetical protein
LRLVPTAVARAIDHALDDAERAQHAALLALEDRTAGLADRLALRGIGQLVGCGERQ